MSGSPVVTYSDGEHEEILAYECTLTVERTETLGEATTESRAELNGFLSVAVLESALTIMREVVDA